MVTFIDGPCTMTAQEARYSEKAIERLHAHYAQCVGSGRLQSAGWLLARAGRVFSCRTMGRLTYEENSGPFRPDSIKGIASISKTITATAIMMLVERGVIWLEQAVREIIPEFNTPMHSGITIWHLLTHTSGLPADPGYFSEPYPIPRFDLIDTPDWIKVILAGPLQSLPGEQWSYCTYGYILLAEIVSRTSGVHWNDFVEREIFKPLGMTRSFVEVPDALIPEVCLIADWSKEWLRSNRDRNSYPKGGGGVYSTLGDLFTFGQCFMNGGAIDGARILGKKIVESMTRNQLSGVPAYHWGKRCKEYRHGLGWGFYSDGPVEGDATFNHEGWGWCSLFIDPVEEFIYVSFVNDAKDWDPEVMVKPRVIAFGGIE